MENTKKAWFDRTIASVRIKDILITFGLYMLFALMYHITLWVNRAGYNDPEDAIFQLVPFIRRGGMQYTIFFLLTIPVWLLIFRGLKDWKLYQRLLVHIVTLPVFVFAAKYIYYELSEAWGMWHLQGGAEVWDVYIPALFYMIQFGFFHAYEYFRKNQEKLKLEGELRQAALKSELSAIKAQLNPHFLYNVFNTINASVPPGQDKTRTMIAQLSDLFRYQLRASQEELVTLGEELEFVTKYLDLEKARYGDRLALNFNVDKALYKEKIPPMLLQPLVENSIKHGLSSIIEGGSISISIFKRGDKLMFELADTGIGIKDKEAAFTKGIGLANTQLRLQKMYQSQLEIFDNQPQGAIIKFAI